jgi:hypothetical protein
MLLQISRCFGGAKSVKASLVLTLVKPGFRISTRKASYLYTFSWEESTSTLSGQLIIVLVNGISKQWKNALPLGMAGKISRNTQVHMGVYKDFSGQETRDFPCTVFRGKVD